ncbi:MAG: tight adherence protein [Acidimicrobiaceae bacterium]
MILSSIRRGVRAVAVAGVALGALALVAPPSAGASAAQASGHTAKLVEVNSTDPDNVSVVFRYDGPASDAATASVKVAENGKPVQVQDTKATRAVGVVLVIDTSASTDNSNVLAEARNAVKALVPTLKAGTSVAVVAAGSDALVAQNFTADPALVDQAMRSLTPAGDGALWEGVTRAGDLIKNQTGMLGSIVLITDGNNAKGTTFSAARGAAIDAGTAVFVVGINGGKLGGEAKDLADATGGTFATSDKAADATSLLGGYTAQLNGLYSFTYKSANAKGVNDLDIVVGDASVRGSYIVGAVASGAAALAYQPPVTAGGFSALQNDLGKYLAIVLGLLGAGLAAYAIIGIAVKDNSGLASVLQPYSEGYVARPGDDDDDDEAESGMAQTAMMQRAVEFTRQFAEKQGFLTRVEGALERANLPLRAAEAMFFYAAGAVAVALLTAVITRSLFLVLIIVGATVLIPPAALNFLSNRRKRQFEAMLPDTLQLLSGTLRAGYSMMQGVEAVSQEVSEPMGRELRRVVTEARLGRPLEESLDAVAERMASPDFGWAVMAIRIQREVGGNLSELLMTVGDTMTQRERLKRDVKSLTAEGRISAYVLAALPVLLGFAMWGLNPDYMSALFDETIGKIALGIAVVMMIAGFAWMQAIVKIDV